MFSSIFGEVFCCPWQIHHRQCRRDGGQEDGAEAAGEQGAHQCGDAHHHEVQGRKHADGDEVGDLQFAGFGGLVELVRGYGVVFT